MCARSQAPCVVLAAAVVGLQKVVLELSARTYGVCMALVLPMQAGLCAACVLYRRLGSTRVLGSAAPRRVSDEIQGRLNFLPSVGKILALGVRQSEEEAIFSP